MSEQVDQERSGEIDMKRLPVGAALRAQREQLGWSLPDVAAWLRIRLPYLEALENGQINKLPGQAYALGFLRAYAGALGLDAEEMTRRFRTETKGADRKTELSFPAPVPERGVPAGAMVLLGVVVVAGAYAGWYEFTGRVHGGQPHVVPPVPTALLPYAGASGSTASPQVATVMPAPGQATPSPVPPSVPAAAAPLPRTTVAAAPAAVSPVAVAPATPVAGPAPAVQPVAPAAQAAPATPVAPNGPDAPNGPVARNEAGAAAIATPAVPPVAAAAVAAPMAAAPVPGQVTLAAVATSWVQVRAGGKVLLDRVMRPGDTWPVPAGAVEPVLTTGNAGGITLAADGVTSPVLGRIGAVRRGIPLSAQSVRDGTVAPDAAAGAVAPAAAAVPAAAPAALPRAAPARAAASRSFVAHPRVLPLVPPVENETDRLNAQQLKGTAPH